MLITLYRLFQKWHTNAARADRIIELEAQLFSLSRRLDTQGDTIAHQHHRNSLLVDCNRQQRATITEQAIVVENLTAQLSVTRALLAAVMRERDEERAKAERHGRVLATVMKRRREEVAARRKEVANLRIWMTRVSAYHVSSN